MKFSFKNIFLATTACVLLAAGFAHADGGGLPATGTYAANATTIAQYAAVSGWHSLLADDMVVAWGVDTSVTPHRMFYSINCTGDQYCAVGWSPKDMDGPMVVCYFPGGVGTCWDYDGSGYDCEAPARARTTVHSAVKAPNSNRVDIVFSLDVSDLGVAPNKEIRVIYAKGPMEAEGNSVEPDTHGMGTNDMWVTWEDTYAGKMRPHKVNLRLTWLSFTIAAVVIVVIWAIGAIAHRAGVILSPKASFILPFAYGAIFVGLFIMVVVMSFSDYKRDAALEPFARALGQGAIFLFGLIFFPVAKHVSFFRFFGISYERTLIYHIIMGFSLFAVLTLHLILMLGAYGDLGWLLGWNKNMIMPNLPGVLSWFFLTILTITSLPPVRRKLFAVFRVTHFLFIPIIVFGIFHVPHVMGYVVAIGCCLWVLDVILRNVTQMSMKPELKSCSFEEKGQIITLEVACHGGIKDYEAGQYAFFTFEGMGALMHPFTIADYNKETKVATFFIKVFGSWTEQLAVAVQNHKEQPLKLRLFQGCYGSLQVPLHKMETVVLVSGGIGVTPMLSLLSAISRKEEGSEHVKRVIFVWSVRDMGLIEACAPFIKSAMANFTDPDRIVDIRVHNSTIKENTSMMESNVEPKFPFDVLPGRPDIDAIAKEAKSETGSGKVSLYCCGPDAVMKSVASAATNNGTYLHSETFEF